METIQTKKQAVAIIGRLYRNSKMPCKSYSLPVSACKLGSILARIAGTTCNGCYAAKGYAAKFRIQVDRHRQHKLAALSHPQWSDAMVVLLQNERYFRWHDSGDLQSVHHLSMITDVCRRTPSTKHWMPTRECAIVKSFLEQGGTVPANLIIRLSATLVDGPVPPQISPLVTLQTSTVHKRGEPLGKACHARDRGGHCGGCRACWSPQVPNVSYHYH